MVKDRLSAACQCGSTETYTECCGRFIDAGAEADTAEQLMRSRYTAYAMRHEAYLRRTWVKAHCPAVLFEQEAPQWIGLKILRTEGGLAGDVAGNVEFVARYRINGRAYRLHEVSEFIRDDGRWLYVKGTCEE